MDYWVAGDLNPPWIVQLELQSWWKWQRQESDVPPTKCQWPKPRRYFVEIAWDLTVRKVLEMILAHKTLEWNVFIHQYSYGTLRNPAKTALFNIRSNVL